MSLGGVFALSVKLKPITSVDDLTPDALNANRHTQRGMAMMETSLRECGYGDSLTVDREGRVISGNGRVETLAAIGMTDAIVVQSDGTRPIIHQRTDLDLATDDRAKRLALLQNRTGQVNLEWDAQVLAELAEQGTALDDLFAQDEMDALLGDLVNPPAGDGGDEFDTTPDDGPTRVQLGEVWRIGPHRIVCGDCTDRATVARALPAMRADLCLTDPPYGVGLVYASTDDTVENLRRLIAGFMPIVREVAQFTLLTPGNKNQWEYPRPDWCGAWVVPQGNGMNSHGFSCWQPVLMYGPDPFLAHCKGSRPDALSKFDTADDVDHPCSKPLAVWMWWLERGSIRKCDTVYDPFLGSGTTLIAAHRLGRVAFGCEVEPRYCDVVLRRAEAEGIGPIERDDG